VSIVRIGLSEMDKFSQGYDAIFGKKKAKATKKAKTSRKTQAKIKAKPKKK